MIFSVLTDLFNTTEVYSLQNAIRSQSKNIEKTCVQAPLSSGYNEAPHDFQIQPLEIFLALPGAVW